MVMKVKSRYMRVVSPLLAVFLVIVMLVAFSMPAAANGADIRPNADSNPKQLYLSAGLTNHYDAIDDAGTPDTATYVYNNNKNPSYKIDWFDLPDQSLSGTINSVTIHMFALRETVNYPSTVRESAYYNMRLGTGPAVSGTAQTLTTSYADYPSTMTTKPFSGGGAWTWTDINNLQIGVSLRGPTSSYYCDSRCTALYITIDYTSIAATSLAVSEAFGNYGGTVNLSATLTSGGAGVAGVSTPVLGSRSSGWYRASIPEFREPP
ncbi:MAG: hypothetical protein JXA46_17295, partial [Dehalococcoidales bacterium]|nr:hypothetical protein [Dehalococcoidales bacterium]